MLRRAAQAFAGGGREAMLETILAYQQRRREAGEGSAYAAAATLAQLGRTEAALDLLDASARAGEPDLLALRVDPMFRPLQGEARFKALVAQLGRPAR